MSTSLTGWPEALYLGWRPAPLVADPVSLDNARALGWAAQLAYEADVPEKVVSVLAGWGWQAVSVFAGAIGTFLPLPCAGGFVARAGTACVVAFSGTAPTRIGDWILDLMARRTEDGLHAGFEAGATAVWPSVQAALEGDGPVFLAGHSLGGALAVVTAQRLVREGILPVARIGGVCTFGMPRVGDAAFARTLREAGLGERILRLVYGADLVANLPPAEAPFAYRHVGRSLACGHGSHFHPAALLPDREEASAEEEAGMWGWMRTALAAPPAQDLPPFPGDRLAALVIDSLPVVVRDHVPDRYLRALGVW